MTVEAASESQSATAAQITTQRPEANVPIFSVIIPTYNRRALLEQALESVWTQSFTDYEIIVVDDGSTDGTIEMLEAQKCGRSAFKVIRQANAGPGAARNRGSKEASGQYLAFLDSDDLWFPWTLATYLQVVERHKCPAFIAGKRFNFTDQRDTLEVSGNDLQCLWFADYLASGDQWRWFGVSSFVILREEMARTRGFVEQNINGEDADLALKLGVAAGFAQVTAPYTFAYRQHDANVTRDLAKSLAGLWNKIRAERAHDYPGGDTRARERLDILTRHIRPYVFECLRSKKYNEAWSLYKATLGWHLRLGRLRFVLGALVFFVWHGLMLTRQVDRKK